MPTNEKNDQIDKIMGSYYGYVGYCHTENIIKELDDKKDEIKRIEPPSNMDVWFNKFSQVVDKQVSTVIIYMQKIKDAFDLNVLNP